MKKYIDCDHVYVDKCTYGLGVFANKDFNKGEIIEKGLMYRLVNVDGNENPHLFTWSDDRTVWAGGSGCLPYYNHSSSPNIQKKGVLAEDRMDVVALRYIKRGEELVGTYYSSKWRECFKPLNI